MKYEEWKWYEIKEDLRKKYLQDKLHAGATTTIKHLGNCFIDKLTLFAAKDVIVELRVTLIASARGGTSMTIKVKF
jgi:hypothetical protein